MRSEIDEVLQLAGGVAAREDLVRRVGRGPVDGELRRGQLIALFPRAYARPWDADLSEIVNRAALISVDGEAALSHLTSLQLWRLPVPREAPIHVTAYQPRHPRGVSGRLVVHRTLRPLRPVELERLPTIGLAPSLVQSWPLLRGSDQRAPIIEACRRRLVRTSTLLTAAHDLYWVSGARELKRLIAQVAGGCESELELWGYLNVFNAPGLGHATRQLPVKVRGRAYRLDMAYETERVAVELDGRRYHSSPDQWAADIARDLAMATIGWQTVRLSHDRLTRDIEGCRRDIRAVLAARRQRLA